MRPNLSRLTLLGTLIALPGLAAAGELTFSELFSLNNTTNFSATTGPSVSDSSVEYLTLAVNGFDDSLGTLTAVKVALASQYVHSGYASAFDTAATFLGAGYYSNDTAIPVVNSLQLAVAPLNFAGTLTATGSPAVAECGPTTFIGTTANTVLCNDSFNTGPLAFNIDYTLTTGLGAFIGLDPLLFTLSNSAWFNGTCDDNDLGDKCYANNDVYWNGALNVTFFYDAASAVPEPAVGALLISGLGLGWHRRRRRQPPLTL